MKHASSRGAAADMKCDSERKFFRPRFFLTGASGRFSKRAFFFSLFAIIAVVYIILCMAGIVAFDEALGFFLFGCNTAFGINYYQNEKNGI